MTEWRETTLGEVVELKRGYDLPAASREPGKVPVVSSSGVTGHHSIAKVHGPGVVTGRCGTLGEVFFIESDFWPLNTALYVRDFKGNEPRFIAALLEYLQLGRNDGAAAVPGVNRNQLHGLPVICPDTDTQHVIAAVLGALDDLIENNRRRIELLEQMAHALYREWFVRFRYPGHENAPLVASDLGPIPEGWELRPLFDVVEPTFGFPFKSKLFNPHGDGMPVIRIRDLPRNGTETWTTETVAPQYEVEDGDILIGMDGDFHMCRWSGGNAYLNQRVVRFRPLKDVMSRYEIFLALERPIRQLNDSIVGTTVAHLGKRHLEALHLVVPSADLRGSAREIFDPMFDLAIQLQKATTNLRATHDLLLPRLISGEIDVSKLDLAGVAESV
jgi:type I restriction enzyme, S subunit